MTYSFETLDVWQYTRELVSNIYKITARFPAEEKYTLTSQLRRSAISVSSNIAEGSARWSKKEQARYYEMAFGSLTECLSQLILALELNFMSEEDYSGLRTQIEQIGRMVNTMYKKAIGQVKIYKLINL